MKKRKLIVWEDGKYLDSIFISSREELKESYIQEKLKEYYRFKNIYVTCGCKNLGEYVKLYIKKTEHDFYTLASFPGQNVLHFYSCPFSGSFIKEEKDRYIIGESIFSSRSGFSVLCRNVIEDAYYFAFNIENKGVDRRSGKIKVPKNENMVEIFKRLFLEKVFIKDENLKSFLKNKRYGVTVGIVNSLDWLEKTVKVSGYISFDDEKRGKERTVYLPSNISKREIPFFFVSLFQRGEKKEVRNFYLIGVEKGVFVETLSERLFVRKIDNPVLKVFSGKYKVVLKEKTEEIPDFLVFKNGNVEFAKL